MKHFILIFSLVILSQNVFSKTISSHFTASIEFNVYDNQEKDIIINEFSSIQKSMYRDIKNVEIISENDKLIFLISSENDLTLPVQKTTEVLIERLNGKVRTRGRSQLFKSNPIKSKPLASLEVATNSSRTSITSIHAKSIPFRELLREIRREIGTFSYLIPTSCANELITFDFYTNGANQDNSLDLVMRELASLRKLNLERLGSSYVFTGSCKNHPMANKFQSIYNIELEM